MSKQSIINRESRAALLGVTEIREIALQSSYYILKKKKLEEISYFLKPVFENYLPDLFIKSYDNSLRDVSEESLDSIRKISGIDSMIPNGEIAIDAYSSVHTILRRTEWDSANDRLLSKSLDSISYLLVYLGNIQWYRQQIDLMSLIANDLEDIRNESTDDIYIEYISSLLRTLIECRADIAERHKIVRSNTNIPDYDPSLSKPSTLFDYQQSFHLLHSLIAKILIDSIDHVEDEEYLISEISNALVDLCSKHQSRFSDLQTVRSFQFLLEVALYSIEYNNATFEEWSVIFSKIMEGHDPETIRAVFDAVISERRNPDSVLGSSEIFELEQKRQNASKLIEKSDEEYRKRNWSRDQIRHTLINSSEIDGIGLTILQQIVDDEHVSLIAEDTNGHIVKISIIKILEEDHLKEITKDGIARPIVITAVDNSEQSMDGEIIEFDQSKHSDSTQRSLYEYLIDSDTLDKYRKGAKQQELSEFTG